MKKSTIFNVSAAAFLLGTVSVQAAVITTGSDDGSVTIDVNEFGQFFSAIFDPIGSLEAANTTFDNTMFIGDGSSLSSLGSFNNGEFEGEFDGELDEIDFEGGDGEFFVEAASNLVADGAFISESETSVRSQFNTDDLSFDLTQTVTSAVEAGEIVGSVLTQTYSITNTTAETNTFDMVRYFDGDLGFDGTIDDGGGRTVVDGQEILFETDATGQESDKLTFVGITATGGTNQGFSITDCCDINEYPLNNFVDGDSDGDGFIDVPYDVTLQLANGFELAPGETAVYSTQTLFGFAAPDEAVVSTIGLTEGQPILPTETSSTGFSFDIPLIDILNLPEEILTSEGFVSRTIFIDPDIATGYTYSSTGANFASVTAPTLGQVNDADGQYTLSFGGNNVVLLAGATFDFLANGFTGIQAFEIGGIDIGAVGFGDGSEELDPTDDMAFVTGFSLTAITGTTTTITQNPVTLFVDPGTTPVNPVPLPASALLLFAGLFGLGVYGRASKA